MIISQEDISKIAEKIKNNQRYSGYFKRLYDETSEDERVYYRSHGRSYKAQNLIKISKKRTLFNKHNKINVCSKYWFWDMYEQNELMDLRTNNMCGYSECPNCRKVQLAKARLEFYPKLEKAYLDGYKMIHITLTVPNCRGSDLRETIEKIGQAFPQFYYWLHQSIEKRYGFSDRYIDAVGAYRALEITTKYTFDRDKKRMIQMYHPHYHVIMAVKNDIDPQVMQKYIEGDWSIKREQVDYYSELDFQIMKLWTLAYQGKTIDKYYDFSMDYKDMLKNELYRGHSEYITGVEGVMELLKYTYKDSQVNGYLVFKTLVNSLFAVRKRMGYGIFRGSYDFEGLTLEKEEKEDILKEILKIEETPKTVLTRISELNTIYHNYTKLSRYKLHEEVSKIKD